MIRYLGDPLKSSDFGINIEPHKYIGKLLPDTDFDYVKIRETSPDQARKGRTTGDAPDVHSTPPINEDE